MIPIKTAKEARYKGDKLALFNAAKNATAGKFDIEKADETRLGFEPEHSNVEALLSNFRWYGAHRDEFAAKSGISHRVRWKQGALGMARHFF